MGHGAHRVTNYLCELCELCGQGHRPALTRTHPAFYPQSHVESNPRTKSGHRLHVAPARFAGSPNVKIQLQSIYRPRN